jgi:hypothetical protein
LLDKVPIYHKGKSDILSVARQVEDVCGPKARGLLVPSAAGMTMKLGPPERPGIDDATFECLLNAISASGMPFGFVGNEIYQEQ